MSDDNTPNNEPDLKELRERAEKAGRLEQANSAKDREIAFLQAGVNTSTMLGRNIMAVHGDKEITPEAIAETTAAVRAELGLPDPDDATPPPGQLTPEQQAEQAAAALHGQSQAPGSTPPPPPKDLIDMAVDTYAAARKSGIGEIEAQEAGIGEIIRAGATGNKQAAYDEQAFQATAREYGHGAEHAGLPERSYVPNVHHTKEHALRR